MRKSTYLSFRIWREQIPLDIRRAILRVMFDRFALRRSDFVGAGWFISTLLSRLREVGEFELAHELERLCD